MNDDELHAALTRRASGHLSADDRNDILRSARLTAVVPPRRPMWPRLASYLVGTVAVVVLVLIALPIVLNPPGPARQSASPGVEVLTTQQLVDLAQSGTAVGSVVIADTTIVPLSGPLPSCDPAIPCPIGQIGSESGLPVTGGFRDTGSTTGTLITDDTGNRWVIPLVVPSGDQRSAFLINDRSVEYLGPAQLAASGRPLQIPDLPLAAEKSPTDDVYVVHGWWWSGMWPNCPAQPQSTPVELDFYCNGFWLTPDRPDTTSTMVAPQDGLLLNAGPYPAWSDQRSPGAPVEGTYVVRSAGCQITLDNRCPVWRLVGRLDDQATTRPSPPPSQTACMAALIEGYLEPDAASGIGILPTSGGNDTTTVQIIEWPNGYAVRDDDGQLTLVDGDGNIVARVGDYVSISGGFVDGLWSAICGDIKVMAPPSASPTTAVLPIASAQTLANLIGDPNWVGKTVLADLGAGDIQHDPCASPVSSAYNPCNRGTLGTLPGPHASVVIGSRDATSADGVQQGDGSGFHWIKPLEWPNDAGTYAFVVGQDSVEYLGPVNNSSVLSVADLSNSKSDPSDDVYVVHGWLTRTPEAPCAFPPQSLESPMPDIGSYYCGGSWLTPESELMPLSGLTYDDGLHVQNEAYMTFADRLLPSGGSSFDGPIEGTYLIRNAGCPEVVTGACPVWRMVGRLDDGTVSAPIQAATPTPIPSPSATAVPQIRVSNSTTLSLVIAVNGQSVGTSAPGSIELFDPSAEIEPWHVTASTTSGRQLIDLTYSLSDIGTNGGGTNPEPGTFTGQRVDLSCGRLDVAIGGEILGPGPNPGYSYPPGDCDP